MQKLWASLLTVIMFTGQVLFMSVPAPLFADDPIMIPQNGAAEEDGGTPDGDGPVSPTAASFSVTPSPINLGQLLTITWQDNTTGSSFNRYRLTVTENGVSRVFFEGAATTEGQVFTVTYGPEVAGTLSFALETLQRSGDVFVTTETLNRSVEVTSVPDVADLLLHMKSLYNYFGNNADAGRSYLVPKVINASVDPVVKSEVTSVAGMGFAYVSYVLAAARGWISRGEAIERINRSMQFFLNTAEKQHGFLYPEYNIATGAAVGTGASTLDTAIYLAGSLVARHYFQDSGITSRATTFYRGLHWDDAFNAETGLVLTGWDALGAPLTTTLDRYMGQLVLYILAMGDSSLDALTPDIWSTFTRVVRKDDLVVDLVPSGTRTLDFFIEPREALFVHQVSHAFFDFRGKWDQLGFNYFQNSISASLANRQYTKNLYDQDPTAYETYQGGLYWGLSRGYLTDGAFGSLRPFRNATAAETALETNSGTVMPGAAMASLPFVPNETLAMFRALKANQNFPTGLTSDAVYGFANSFNFAANFVDKRAVALDKGLEFAMMENYLTGFVWNVFGQISEVQTATAILSFTGSAPAGLPNLALYPTPGAAGDPGAGNGGGGDGGGGDGGGGGNNGGTGGDNNNLTAGSSNPLGGFGRFFEKLFGL